MRVFMLGWEFPPFISGGLGTACYGLTRGLSEVGVDVTFVLPRAVAPGEHSHVQILTPAALARPSAGSAPAAGTAAVAGAEGASPASMASLPARVAAAITSAPGRLDVHRLDAVLRPYCRPDHVEEDLREILAQQPDLAAQLPPALREELAPDLALPDSLRPAPAAGGEGEFPSGTFGGGPGGHYEGDLMAQVYRYARLAERLACQTTFDVIHAHDWMTYPAGLAAAAATGKPLVVHLHSTEFDRSGEHVNQEVYDIERTGMHAADCVICVSHLTARIAASRYAVPESRIQVVYNAVEMSNALGAMPPIERDEKIVLFLGRVTMQKGPDYFLRAAKKVAEKFPKVRFVMAGSGDMITQCVRQVADLGLGRHVTFTGFLRGADVDRVFQMADLYVMPSVSEPFGIAPLEALSHNVPVIISKQSGVSEVLTHVLKVDFWDIDEMANKILAVLRHPSLQRTLRQHGQIELRKLSWRDSAARVRDVYARVTGAGAH